MELHEIFRISNDFNYVLVEATVPTGMETSALSEVKEKIPWLLDVCKARGRVFFCTRENFLHDALSLRSVDSLYIVVIVTRDLVFPNGKEEALHLLEDILNLAKWDKAVEHWKNVSGFKGKCFPSKEEYYKAYHEEIALKGRVKELSVEENQSHIRTLSVEENSALPQKVKDYKEKRNALKQSIITKAERQALYQNSDNRQEESKVVKFRMTCYRTGTHSFSSPEVACYLGGKLQDKFNWVVSLVHHDLEAVVNIRENDMYLAVALNKESLHKRNIVHFGPTTLRATVCYNLLRMAAPCPGDIVLDPLCGGASIPVEVK